MPPITIYHSALTGYEIVPKEDFNPWMLSMGGMPFIDISERVLNTLERDSITARSAYNRKCKIILDNT